MNPMEVRLQALRLSIEGGTPKSEVLAVARNYVAFLREDDAQKTPTVTPSEKAVPPKTIAKVK